MTPREEMIEEVELDGYDLEDFTCIYTVNPLPNVTLPPSGPFIPNNKSCPLENLPDEVTTYFSCHHKSRKPIYTYDESKDPKIERED